jgi:hypothetical protein
MTARSFARSQRSFRSSAASTTGERHLSSCETEIGVEHRCKAGRPRLRWLGGCWLLGSYEGVGCGRHGHLPVERGKLNWKEQFED